MRNSLAMSWLVATLVVAGAVPAAAAPLLSPPGVAVRVKHKAAAPAEDAREDNAFFQALYKVNSFYPVVLDRDLEPEVRSKVIPLWATTVCCGAFCGPLWIPMVIVGENPGAEYFLKEALIAIAVETAAYLLGGATTSFAGLGTILVVANLVYFAPVSLIDGYDRALKRQRAKAAEQDDQETPSPPKRKQHAEKSTGKGTSHRS